PQGLSRVGANHIENDVDAILTSNELAWILIVQPSDSDADAVTTVRGDVIGCALNTGSHVATNEIVWRSSNENTAASIGKPSVAVGVQTNVVALNLIAL